MKWREEEDSFKKRVITNSKISKKFEMDLSNQGLSVLPNIEEEEKILNLARNVFKSVPENLPFSSLQKLDLSGNSLSSLHFAESCPALKNLDLSGNRLFDLNATIDEIQSKCKNLISLSLNGNPWQRRANRSTPSSKRRMSMTNAELRKRVLTKLDNLRTLDSVDTTSELYRINREKRRKKKKNGEESRRTIHASPSRKKRTTSNTPRTPPRRKEKEEEVEEEESPEVLKKRLKAQEELLDRISEKWAESRASLMEIKKKTLFDKIEAEFQEEDEVRENEEEEEMKEENLSGVEILLRQAKLEDDRESRQASAIAAKISWLAVADVKSTIVLEIRVSISLENTF